MITNSNQFLKEQYGDSSKLDIRIGLHEMYSTSAVDWHEWVFEHMKFGRESRIIEFGCGSGALWAKNKSKIRNDWFLTLTDRSEGMLVAAKQSIGELPNAEYKVMDVQAPEVEDASYDIAVANHMLYHVPNIHRALAEIKRILKPGGKLYASTNGLNHIREIYDFAREFDSALPFTKPLDSQHFDMENGERLLRNHFGQVQWLRFESDLRVTNVQHLAEYMFSIGTELKEALQQKGSYEQFIGYLESKRNEQGYIHVSKETGMFVCSD